ncbi:MAG: acyl-CoA desaturase, partial [Cyanobacteria bacterium J06649_4]
MTIATSTDRPLNWPIILFMVGIHVGALFAFVPGNTNWGAVGVAFVLYFITGCLGI